MGAILYVKKYHKNGERDSVAYPEFTTLPLHDTLKIGVPVLFKARIVNVLYKRYSNGRLIISSSLDTTEFATVINVKDTLALIDPQDTFTYSYRFTPHKTGVDYICGEFVFKDTTDRPIRDIETRSFIYPIFVKK